MEKSLNSSFTSQSFPYGGPQTGNVSWNEITTPAQFVVSTPSSIAGPSRPSPVIQDQESRRPTGIEPSSLPPQKSPRKYLTKPEDQAQSAQTAARFASCLALDHIAALYPNVDAPFENALDVVNRLLPYHVYQYPKEGFGRGKGKAKAHDNSVIGSVNEIKETEFALECVKRRNKLVDRFRRARIRSGRSPNPDPQAYVLAQAVLESERTATSSLNAELREARTEKDRLEREKRVVSMTRASPYSVPQGTYYRGYPYTYAPPYQTQPLASSSVSGYSTSTPITPSTPSAAAAAAIPVQVPVSSLPALQALGIHPVPVSSLPPPDQPQPLAILRSSTANGTMLSLEINVSLLQSAQMSGLAIVLNSLMARNGDATASTGTGATPSQVASHLANLVGQNHIQGEPENRGSPVNGTS